jgi:hypothetical protein
MRDHPGLARAGTGDHHDRPGPDLRRRPLVRVEVAQQVAT